MLVGADHVVQVRAIVANNWVTISLSGAHTLILCLSLSSEFQNYFVFFIPAN